MENSATSRICVDDQYEATSFHRDSSISWSSSMDDLIFFDQYYTTTTTTTSDDDEEDFQSLVCFSAQPSAASSHHRKRRKTAADDDELEDTATSPPHPTIISKMGCLNSKQKIKKQRAMMNQTKHKEGNGSEEYGEVEDRSIEVGFVGRRDNINSSTGLQNIGLCLVPLSMALTHFG